MPIDAEKMQETNLKKLLIAAASVEWRIIDIEGRTFTVHLLYGLNFHTEHLSFILKKRPQDLCNGF